MNIQALPRDHLIKRSNCDILNYNLIDLSNGGK